MKLNLTKPLIVFDLETTGLDLVKDRIIQISYIKVYPDGKDTIMASFIYDDIELREEEPWFVCKCGKKTTLL